MPNTAKRDGFNLKISEETNMDQIGVVFTSTVAFIMVVSKTAETNRMKCNPIRTPRSEMRRMSFRRRDQLKRLIEAKTTMVKMSEAITKRQKAMENPSLMPPALRRFMKIAAVPNSAPATTPSRSATRLLLFGKL